MAQNNKLEKGPHEAEMFLSCAHIIVLVIVYKNDPTPTLQNISRTYKSGPVNINKIVKHKPS